MIGTNINDEREGSLISVYLQDLYTESIKFKMLQVRINHECSSGQ